MINNIIKKLKKFNDKTLRHDLGNNNEAVMELVKTYFHCG